MRDVLWDTIDHMAFPKKHLMAVFLAAATLNSQMDVKKDREDVIVSPALLELTVRGALKGTMGIRSVYEFHFTLYLLHRFL